MSQILIISYITNTDNIEFFINNFNEINTEIILINNLNIDINLDLNLKIYKNLTTTNINYLIDNNNSDFVLVTNTNVLFSYNFINWLNQILLECKEDYYIANFIELDNKFDKSSIVNDDCFIKCINNIKYISNIGIPENNKLEKFINEYNTKQYLFQYDNLNENKLLLDKSYNFLLVHKNIINKYGFYSDNYFDNLQHSIINYFENLKYINVLPYVLSIFIISTNINYTKKNKIRNIFIGNKIDEGIERERKDKKIKQLQNQNTNLQSNLEENVNEKNNLQKKIEDIKNIIIN